MSFKLDTKFGVSIDKAEFKKVESQLDALYNKYKDKNIVINANTKNISDAKTKVKKLDSSLNKASNSTKDFNNRMKTAVSSTIQWTIAVGGLYSVINKLKDSFEFTAEFDKSLTEIAMVTGRTRDEVSDLKDEYLELGKVLKVSSLELANSAVALYRQGLAANEVNDRLAEISKTAKVAGLSIDSVTTAVTSGVNAMNVSATEFNDTLLKVASVAATDYDKLARALQKSASSFKTAGFDLQQSVAAIATIQEVTQESAESIGTSLKSVIARFNRLNEAGQDNTDVLNKIDKALKSVGLSLGDSQGQLKDVDTVLSELAPRWGELDKNQRAYLTTQIAGARQANRFLVLMDNYNRMLEIQKDAYKSAGTTQEQYLKFQESIKGKLGELQNAWERLYDSIVDEGTIGDFISLATQLVEMLIELNENVGLLNIAIGIGLTKALRMTAIAFNGFATSATIAKVAMGGLATILGTIAVIGAVKLFDELVVTLDEVDNKIETTSNQLKELNNSGQSLDELGKKFDELKDKAFASTEEQKEFIDVQNQIAEILPETVLYFDEQGNAVISLEENYESLTNQIKEAIREQEKLKAEQAQEGLGIVSDESESARGRMQAYVDMQNILEEQIEKGIITEERRREILLEQGEVIKSVAGELNKADKDFKKYATRVLETSGVFQELNEYEKAFVIEQLNTIDTTRMTSEEFDALTKSLKYNNLFVQDLVKSYTVAGDDIRGEMMGIKQAAHQVAMENEEISDSLEDVTSSLSSLASAFDEINDAEELTAEQIINLINKYPEYLGYLGSEKTAKEAAIKLTEALFEAEKQKAANIVRFKIAEIEAEKTLAEAEEIRLEMLAQRGLITAEEFNKAIGYTDELGGLYTTLNTILNSTIDSFNGIGDAVDDSKKSADKLVNTLSKLDDLKLKAFQQQQEDLNELLDVTVDYIKQQKEDQKEILKDRKKSLRLAEKERDFIKSQSEISEDMSDLQAEIAELSLDTSREGVALRQQLEEELAEQQKELDELNYERSIEIQEDALDEQIAQIDDYLSKEGQLVQDAMNLLNESFEDAGSTLMQDLIKWNDLYGTSIESDIVSVWENAKSAVAQYKSEVGGIGAFTSALQTVGEKASDQEIINTMQERGQMWWDLHKQQEDATSVEQLNRIQDAKNELVNLNESDAQSLSFDVYKSGGRWYNAQTDIPIYGNGARFDGTTPHLGVVGDTKETMIPDKNLPQFLTEALRMAIPKINYSAIGDTTNVTDGDIIFNISGEFNSREDIDYLTNQIITKINRKKKTRG